MENQFIRNNPLKLVFATTNMHKIRELKAILSKTLPNLDILSLLDFPKYTPPEETGRTIRENAILKAENAAQKLNCFALAEDSGLIVPALNGEPGVYSARYAGKNASDLDNRKLLLEKMKNLTDKDRYGYFECCIAIASPEKLIKCACASCEGMIIEKEKGGGGFGYDSIFIKHDYNKTFGELDEDIKNRISHRRKAVDKILPMLEELVK